MNSHPASQRLAADAYLTTKRAIEAAGGPLFPKGKKAPMPDMSFFDDVLKDQKPKP